MTKISEMTEKISPVANDVLAWLDSEDTNNATKNKTFKLSSLWNAIFGNRTSDNIPEGSTSLYATETNLWNSTIIQALQNDKADKDNVLELDNTTEYIPTEDYHPATKEYVDTRSLPDASETVKGVVEKATQAETIAWTSDKYLDAAQIKSRYSNWDIIAWTDFTAIELNTRRSTTSLTPVMVKSAYITYWWTYRINFVYWTTNDALNGRAYSQIYKNWTPYWALNTWPISNSTDQNVTESLSFDAWDSVELYIYKNADADWADAANFNIKYSIYKEIENITTINNIN